jgi:hypothetical protein
MAQNPQSASFASIITAIKARVAATVYYIQPVPNVSVGQLIDPAYVRLVASDNYVVNIAEPIFVYVRYYPPGPLPDGGAGRGARFVHRLVRFYLYTRQGVDVYGDDTVALTSTGSPNSGHILREEQLYNAFDDWFPQGPMGQLLTVEPLHPQPTGNGPVERKPEDEEGILRSAIDFEVVYLSNVTTTEPAPAPGLL